MDDKISKSPRRERTQLRPPFDCIALVLQGGGALGAYQGGVYEGLAKAGIHPNWIGGISIGAVNAAIIAGNPPEARVEKLRQFWELITSLPQPWSAPPMPGGGAAGDGGKKSMFSIASSPLSPMTLWANPFDFSAMLKGDAARNLVNQWSAGRVMMTGAPGFFAPRPVTPWLSPEGSSEATSYYDTSQLKSTLERFADFDRINSGETRLSVGAVNVRSGNFVYFDTTTHRIVPEHVMASGALPPGFPAVEIDGEEYWDGGLISNTPLRWVVDHDPQKDTLVFHVDLWSARGELPRNMARVSTRQKEIMFSSRTRAAASRFKEMQRLRSMLAQLFGKLPPELAQSVECSALRPYAEHKVWNLVHLIYRAKNYEGDTKDFEFSRQSMEEHWRAGYHDTVRTLRHPEVLERPKSADGVFIFDVAEDGRE
jgi:NTE family protein